jgi:hypothetical protein
MADFITMLFSGARKLRRDSWPKDEFVRVNNFGCFEKPDGTFYHISTKDLSSTNWQEYKEPEKEQEQIKVWVGNGCMEFYLAKEKWTEEDTEATPDQLRSIRAALGIEE